MLRFLRPGMLTLLVSGSRAHADSQPTLPKIGKTGITYNNIMRLQIFGARPEKGCLFDHSVHQGTRIKMKIVQKHCAKIVTEMRVMNRNGRQQPESIEMMNCQSFWVFTEKTDQNQELQNIEFLPSF